MTFGTKVSGEKRPTKKNAERDGLPHGEKKATTAPNPFGTPPVVGD